MKYLISYLTGNYGLKTELEDGDEVYAEVPDDFAFIPGKKYKVFSDGTYEVTDEHIAKLEDSEELG